MNTHYLQMAVIVSVVLVIVLYTYIRISYGFWFYQPVFHLYDFYSYAFPCGIVEHGMPAYTKFTNLQDIQMHSVADIQGDHRFQQFVNFVNSHFLRDADASFSPKVENVLPYFTNNKHPSFVSFYYKNELLQNATTTKLVKSKKIIGVMTTRPIQIKINSYKKEGGSFYAYYVDYLCVHKDHRKKGVAPEIIQTHYYQQRRQNSVIHANLFKREGELTGIVPLCVFPSYMYPLNYELMDGRPQDWYKNVRCSAKNLHFLMEFVKEHSLMFDITICTDLSNILDLINTENYYIEYVVDTANRESVVACYFFKKACVSIDRNKQLLTCVASIKSDALSRDQFMECFKKAMFSVRQSYTHVVVECISHNTILADEIAKYTPPFAQCPNAYFFHNFVYNTFLPHKVIVVGT